MQVLLVALGGALGSVLRFVLARMFNPVVVGTQVSTSFPTGTLLVNTIGCFVIGLVFVLLQQLGDPLALDRWRAFLMVGLLGGFTTFSAFSLETMQLIQFGFWQQAMLNIIVSVGLCLAGTAAGIQLAKAAIHT